MDNKTQKLKIEHELFINTVGFFFFFSLTLGLQLPLRIWWSSVGHPRIHKASPGVLLVMARSLIPMPDGS
jgi:hypothetical protein